MSARDRDLFFERAVLQATRQVMIFVVLAMLRSCNSLPDAITRPLSASIRTNEAAEVLGAAA